MIMDSCRLCRVKYKEDAESVKRYLAYRERADGSHRQVVYK